MPKVTKVVDGEYIGGDSYQVTPKGNGKSSIVFSPDATLKAGTVVGSEIMNEIQNNIIYEVDGMKVIEGQDEIYNCTLTGIETFDFSTIKLMVKFNSDNTKDCYIRLGGIKYKLKNRGSDLVARDIVSSDSLIVAVSKITGTADIKNNNYSGLDSNSNVRVASSKSVKNINDDLTLHKALKVSTTQDGHMTKEDKVLLSGKFDNIGTEIQTGTDLNTMRTCGHFKCSTNATAGGLANNPFGSLAFTMVVDSISGDNGAHTNQIATSLSDGHIKYRTTSNSGVNWTNWVQIANFTDLDRKLDKTGGDVGFLSIGGKSVSVITSYSTSAIGYRIHSDGFKEAWGIVNLVADESVRTINLPFSFSNTNYNIASNTQAADYASDIIASFWRNGTSGLYYMNNSIAQPGVGTGYWYVCGY